MARRDTKTGLAAWGTAGLEPSSSMMPFAICAPLIYRVFSRVVLCPQRTIMRR